MGVPALVSKVVTFAPPASVWIAAASGVTASSKQVPVTRMCNPPGEALVPAAALSTPHEATMQTRVSRRAHLAPTRTENLDGSISLLLWDGASRTRTGDLLGAIQALSQLSYSPAAAQFS